MAHTTTAPRAKTVTYKARVADREYGVIRSIQHHYVTLTRDHKGVKAAVVDGENVPFAEAVALLNAASQTEKIEEFYWPTPTIGKARACELHRELGRLGYRSATHYALAEQALERPVSSLAALTEEEAATVRSYAYGQLSLATGEVAA